MATIATTASPAAPGNKTQTTTPSFAQVALQQSTRKIPRLSAAIIDNTAHNQDTPRVFTNVTIFPARVHTTKCNTTPRHHKCIAQLDSAALPDRLHTLATSRPSEWTAAESYNFFFSPRLSPEQQLRELPSTPPRSKLSSSSFPKLAETLSKCTTSATSARTTPAWLTSAPAQHDQANAYHRLSPAQQYPQLLKSSLLTQLPKTLQTCQY